MARPHVFAGAVASVTSNTITIANTPAFTASQFVYNGTTQRERYYVEVVSGTYEGARYLITANDAATLTVDTEGDNLTSHPSFGALAANSLVRIFPYWRVKDVFENNGTPVIESRVNSVLPKDDLLFPNYVTVNQNKAPNLAVYHLANTGWRAVGQGSTDYADHVIRPNEAVIVRRRNVADVNVVNLGQVQMIRSVSFIPGGNGTLKNDTYIGLNHPAPIALSAAGLHDPANPTTSVIRASANTVVRTDELLAFDPNATGTNRPPTTAYFYLAGTYTPPATGWRKVGSGSTDVGSDILQPGRAYIVRKAKDSNGVDWAKEPNY
jgi:uncharacterized protein (TIGR02597 family)